MIMQMYVNGKLACFTRPETRVERYSYDVPTPSAVKAIFESVYWKPEFQWIPLSVSVLAPIKRISFKTNEVKRYMYTKHKNFDVLGNRTQRLNTVLRDVEYLLEARVDAPAAAERIKHESVFKRYLDRGYCFRPPCFGLKQFRAHFDSPNDQKPIDETRDLGPMFYGYDYTANKQPMFFHASIKNGVVQYPTSNKELIY